MSDLRYPIGKLEIRNNLTPEDRARMIDGVAAAPARIRAAVEGLSADQLDTPYRPEGWTVRQVIHHLADSHLNGYVRFRLALTEEEPTIKPYNEKQWAELEDARSAPVEVSLALLDSVHDRWVRLLRTMKASDFSRTFRHPERGVLSLDINLQIYDWHSLHHAAHITSLRRRSGWE